MDEDEILITDELRPGNWVWDRPSGVNSIVKAVSDTIYLENLMKANYTRKLCHLEPILINERILSLAKFKMVQNYYERQVSKDVTFCIIRERPTAFRIDDNEGRSKTIFYVHQLQNAFFDLSGYELEISLIGS